MTGMSGRGKRWWGLLVAIGFSIGHWTAWADVPRTIGYQGKLTETNGVPLTGDHAVTIRLYDAATEGVKLWEEQHALSLTALDNGVFSLVLGAVTPFGQGISFNAPLWLTIEVDGGGEFSPRQPLSSVGYALNADTLDGLDSTALLAAAAGQGDITAVTAGVGLTGGGEAGAVSLSVDVGTTAGKLVQLDANGALPAVSGANLTGITASLPDASVASAQIVDGTIAAADTAETFLAAGSGVTLVKSDASWTISAVVDGASLTNLNASALASGTVPDARLSTNVSLLGPSIGAAELEDGAIQAGDIEVGDLPAHTHGSGNRATSFASSTVDLEEDEDTLLSVTITKSQGPSAILLLATVQLKNTAGSKRETTLKLFRGSTQLDGSYAVINGGKNDPAGKMPVTLHAVDATTATGSLTYTLKAGADEDGDMQATVRRLTALELP